MSSLQKRWKWKSWCGTERTASGYFRHLSKECYVTGDTEHCVFAMGPAAGLVKEVKPVKAIIDDMISEAEAVYKRQGTLQV